MRTRIIIILLLLSLAACFAGETPRCLAFDGEQNYVYIQNTPLNFTGRFTLECWLNIHSFTSGGGILCNGIENTSGIISGYGIFTEDSNRILIRLGNGTNEAGVVLDSVQAGIWQHLALTYDKYKNDEEIVVFLNGKIVKKADCNITPGYVSGSSQNGLYLGKTSSAQPAFFRGMLDEVRFWSLVRSNAQILSHMSSEMDSLEAGLAGCYSFNEDSSSILNDRSPRENHGLMVDMDDSCRHISYAHLNTLPPGDISFNRLVLTWGCSPLYSAFHLDMSADEDFSSPVAGFPVSGITTSYYVVDDIEPGTYYYRVKGEYENLSAETAPWSDIREISTVSDAATPVTLGAFSALKLERGIRLSWTAESQTENSAFLLRRSCSDGSPDTLFHIPGNGTQDHRMQYRFLDPSALSGKTYFYALHSISFSGTVEHCASLVVSPEDNGSPLCDDFRLGEAYPNPFNPRITLPFSVPWAVRITLSVYSSQGRLIEHIFDGEVAQGEHAVHWEPGQLPSGVYILNVRANGLTRSCKLLYIK